MLIGTSDFLGARSAGRTTALQTTTAAFLAGGVAAMFYSPLLGNPRFEDIALGALSGVALAIALTTLWRAYALSSIGVAAPIAAVVSTVVPVLYGAARGDAPGPLGWLGMAVGVMALFVASWQPAGDPSRVGVTLGLVSGLFFSAMYIIAISTSDEAGTWPIVPQRLTAFVLAFGAALITRQKPFAPGSARRVSMLGSEHEDRVERQHQLVVVHHPELGGERAGEALGRARQLIDDAMRSFSGEHRHDVGAGVDAELAGERPER